MQFKTKFKCKWLNIKELCTSYLHLFGKDAVLAEVYYFSAIPYYMSATKPHRISRHKSYIKCLEDTGVNIELGRFKEKDVYCQKCKSMTLTHEEKETDVAIGIKLLEVGFRDLCDVVVVVSGDTDLAPAAKRFDSLFPEKKIVFAFPFARKNKELLRLAPQSFSISKKQYYRHNFSDPFTLSNGTKIRKPSSW